MILKILLYVGIMGLGVVLSRSGKVHDIVYKWISWIQLLALFFLLFIMGVNLGSNKKVMKEFGTLGLHSVVVSLFTIGFSVLFVFIFRKTYDFIKNKNATKKLNLANEEEKR